MGTGDRLRQERNRMSSFLIDYRAMKTRLDRAETAIEHLETLALYLKAQLDELNAARRCDHDQKRPPGRPRTTK
jgi:hypothetical protein